MTRLVQLGIIGLPNASLFSHMKTTSSATENEITAKKIFKNKHSGKNTIVVIFKDESTTKGILTQKKMFKPKNIYVKENLTPKRHLVIGHLIFLLTKRIYLILILIYVVLKILPFSIRNTIVKKQ